MNLLSKELLVVALGGAFGSVVRLLLSRWVQAFVPYENFPFGILLVNVLGCFVIGILYVLFEHHELTGALWRVGLFVGLLGGFTTFSTFSLDSILLLKEGAYFSGIANILASLAFCLLGTVAGIWSASVFL